VIAEKKLAQINARLKDSPQQSLRQDWDLKLHVGFLSISKKNINL
jgi:hypothetical protein